MRHGALLAGLLCLGLLTACGDDDGAGSTTDGSDAAASNADGGASTPDVDGRDFVSSATEGHDLVPGSEIRISFQDDALSVNAGCNTMNGGYSFEGSTMRVEMLATTEMGCEEQLMAQDAFLADLLTSGPTVELDGDLLTITSGETTLTLLDRQVAEPDLPLEDTIWQLESIVSDDAVSSVPGGVESTLTFADDGTVAVDTGCNTGSGPVEVGDGTLTFGPLAMTMRFCEGDPGEVEMVVTTTLIGDVSYEIDSDVLSIRDGDGSGLDYRAATAE